MDGGKGQLLLLPLLIFLPTTLFKDTPILGGRMISGHQMRWMAQTSVKKRMAIIQTLK